MFQVVVVSVNMTQLLNVLSVAPFDKASARLQVP